MKRLIRFGSLDSRMAVAIVSAWVLVCTSAPSALAQHAGGHMGGAPAGHVSAPPAAHSAPPPAAPRPVALPRPPAASPITHTSPVRPAAIPIVAPPSFVIHPRRPFAPPNPVIPVPIFIWTPGFGPFGFPFFNTWPAWGLNYGLWTGCGLNWGWDYGCEAPPPYAYPSSAEVFSPYSLAPGNGQTQAEIQNAPVYFTGQEASQYVHLYLKDGTIYFATDYWLVNGALHFKSVEEGGTKVVERTIDFDRLDLQKTIDVNTARGFRFVLRNEPLEQYFRDHPSTDAPNGAPTEPEPAPPQ